MFLGISTLLVFFICLTEETKLVAEQLVQLEPYNVFDEIDALQYVSIGPNHLNYSVTNPLPKIIKSNRSMKAGNEVVTLTLLHKYCTANPNDTVFYIHTKGSFHEHFGNEMLRKNMMKSVLFCLKSRSVFEHSDLCGLRFSPVPYPQL